MQRQIDPRFIQGTAEWHALRKTKVTATDARVIAGVDPWKNILDVYQDKISTILPTSVKNFAMQRGLDLETEALDLFEKITDYAMYPKVILHPTIDFMMASLDGIEVSGKAIVEIKCPGKVDHECALDGEVPAKYIPQLMHQMECSGLKKAYYFSYAVTSYKVLEVHFDEKYVENLLKEEKEFWNCVLTKTEPKSKKKYIEMTTKEWIDAATEYRDLQRQIKNLENRQRACKNKLLAIAAGQQVQGAGLTISKTIKRGIVEYQNIPELKTVDLEKYRKESREEWNVRVQ